jgi:hypothetical protein
MLGWNRGGGNSCLPCSKRQTDPGAHPAIKLVMGVSRMRIGGYDEMDIYSSLGDRNTAVVLLVRSVGSQKRRRTENIEIHFTEINFVM